MCVCVCVCDWVGPQVLPPLKDVTNRPEVGTTIRNKLVRLMTHVDMGVKQSAAEFLFVLCKESGKNERRRKGGKKGERNEEREKERFGGGGREKQQGK